MPGSFPYSGLLVASWMNCALFAVEGVAATIYFTKYSPRTLKKWWLIGMLCNDVAQTVVVCVITYLYLLVWIPRPMYHTWTTPLTMMQTHIACMFEQLFLLHRLYTLSKNWWYTLFILLLCIVHTAFDWTGVIWISVHREFKRDFGVTAYSIAAIISSSCDILIALGTVYTAWNMETTFAETKSMLRRIMYQAIASGSITSAFTCLKLAMQYNRSNPLSPIMNNCIGRVYSLTVIFTLFLLKWRSLDSTNEDETRERPRPVTLTTVRFDDGSINTDIMDYRENLYLESTDNSSAFHRNTSGGNTPDALGDRKSEEIQAALERRLSA